MSNSHNYIRVAAVVGIDLGSKWFALHIGTTPFTDPVTNTRFALGLFGTREATMVAAMVIGVVGASWHFKRITQERRIQPWAADLILAGAIANCIDRATTGVVHDFIPAGAVVFNLADVALIVGFGAWSYQSLAARKAQRSISLKMANRCSQSM